MGCYCVVWYGMGGGEARITGKGGLGLRFRFFTWIEWRVCLVCLGVSQVGLGSVITRFGDARTVL